MTKILNTKFILGCTGLVLSLNSIFAADLLDLRKFNNQKNKNSISSISVLKSLESNDIKFNKLKVFKDSNGNTHIKYQQTYKGIPVLGKNIFEHRKNKASKINYNGLMLKNIESDVIDTNPSFNSKTALSLAKQLNLKEQGNNKVKATSKDNLIYENENSELVIYNDAKTNRALLAYKVSFFVDNKNQANPSRPYYIIDAKTKEVIKKWNGLTFNKIATGPGGNDKIGRYEYGVDYPEMDVRQTSRDFCFFTNSKVRTIDLHNQYYDIKDQTFHYKCARHEGDEVNGAASPLNDAHYFGSVIFDMYKDWYDTEPLAFKLKMRVHYGEKYENAFWNGTSMTFGDGDKYFYPLVSLDVAAHEVSHGFTEQNSGLEYQGQSGGMNEAFSDMAGKAAEYYSRGKNTWGLGEDITKFSRPLRNMEMPELDGVSIGDARDFHDELDVHYSSGVYNKVFANLAMTPGWDTKAAFDVFVHSNMYYWTPNSDFLSGAIDAVNSAEDLGYDQQDVINAFNTVGIDCKEDSCKLMERKQDDSDSNSDNDNDEDDIDFDDLDDSDEGII